jgi:muramidase (phage lysozyme)
MLRKKNSACLCLVNTASKHNTAAVRWQLLQIPWRDFQQNAANLCAYCASTLVQALER